MGRQTSHRIFVCTTCRYRGGACRPGYRLIETLRKAIEAAGDAVAKDFAISGTIAMAECSKPCLVAFHATREAAYVFGDVEEGDGIDGLVDYARRFRAEQDRGSDASRLAGAVPVRMPAAMIVAGADETVPS